jgi:hypothetical protein
MPNLRLFDVNEVAEKLGRKRFNFLKPLPRRLPGCIRGLGAVGSGEQRMVYLNPGVSTEEPIARRL